MRWLIVLLVRCFKRLPPRLAIRLGATIGYFTGHVIRFRRRIVEGQIRIALRVAEPGPLADACYHHFGLLVVELLRLPFLDDTDLAERVIWHGRENLAVARERGVLLIGAHLGNWELLVQAIAREGIPLHAVGKVMRHRAGDTLRKLLRDENGVPTVPTRNSARDILRLLHREQSVGFLIDQHMADREAVFVDFLGQPARALKAVAQLALHTGRPVIPGFTWRDADDWRHHVAILPPLTAETVSDNPAENIRHNTQRFTDTVAKMVHEHPEQWLWLHKRWKARPPDAGPNPFPY